MARAAATAAAVALSASAAGAATQCASFARFKHDQRLPNGTRVGDFVVSAYGTDSVRIYDPRNDGAPKGLQGALVGEQGIEVRLARPVRHQRARVVYVSDSAAPQTMTLTRNDGQGVVPQVRLPASPQNTRLELVNAAPLATRAVFEGHELIVSKFCLEK